MANKISILKSIVLLYGRAFDSLLKMNDILLVNLLSIRNSSGGSIFHSSIPGDVLAYLWLDLLQYKQRIHLFKGLVVNNAEGRGQFLSKAATASSGRQFQKPVCLLSWLTLKDPCCSPAPPHKQTADDFIVCPLLSGRRVQGVWWAWRRERTSVAPGTHSIPLWRVNKTLQKSYVCYSYSVETENIEGKCKCRTILLVLFI